jgi:hypothetical protein
MPNVWLSGLLKHFKPIEAKSTKCRVQGVQQFTPADSAVARRPGWFNLKMSILPD